MQLKMIYLFELKSCLPFFFYHFSSNAPLAVTATFEVVVVVVSFFSLILSL